MRATLANTDHREETLRALHTLLHDHPTGLAAGEIAAELNLSPQEVETLLATEVTAQLVDIRGYEEGSVLYVTLRRIKPDVSFHEALAALRHSRAKPRPRRPIPGIVAVLVATAFVGSAAWFITRSAERDPSPSEDSSSLPINVSHDDRVAARVAAERVKQWTAEAQEADIRIARLDSEAASADCEAKWRDAQECYISNRLLTKASFDQERAALALRAAELRALIQPTQ